MKPMNPYDFVRMDWTHPPHRQPAVKHDSFSGWAGQIACTLVAETPLFLPDTQASSTPKPFLTNAGRRYIVPGSSLKGLLRSLVETLGPGCWWLFDGQYESNTVHYGGKLPGAFKRCQRLDTLCPACSMFGMLGRGNDAILLGKVSVDDAVCTHAVPHNAIYTPPLLGPKPHHGAWYLGTDQQLVAGRKFYFHQSQIQTGNGALSQHIWPLNTGSAFDFRVQFTNMREEELALLIFALALEPAMRHKIGYAKPAGFGSVRITIQALERWKMRDRYVGGTRENLHDDVLSTFIQSQVATASARIAPVTLEDLRRIWRWPPTGTYAYPGRQWFTNHSTDPISATAEG